MCKLLGKKERKGQRRREEGGEIDLDLMTLKHGFYAQ